MKQTIEPDNQYIVDLIKVGSPIGKRVRTDLDPNLKSPIRPYGDASFLSLRDHFFGEGIISYDPNQINKLKDVREHPTVLSSQPEIFNRNEDEEIDETDDHQVFHEEDSRNNSNLLY